MNDLWGQTIVREEDYFVFHDESESMPKRRWLLVGLSFVKKGNIQYVREALGTARQREKYCGEIHFSGLPKSFDGSYGAKARVALSWMKAFESELAKYLYFSCLAVDRHSRAYEPKRYPHAWYEYNRFTAMALKAGIAWHIGPEDLDRVNIQFVSDAKQRVSRPDLGMVDNFEKYLPYRAELDAFLSEASGRRYPGVEVKVQLNDSKSDDLLQLTDLFLGAIQMALVGASSRPVKRTLGTFAGGVEILGRNHGNKPSVSTGDLAFGPSRTGKGVPIRTSHCESGGR